MARSIMLTELTILMDGTSREASLEEIRRHVLEENLLGKETYSSREKSLHHLTDLYGLDCKLALFRLLRRMYSEEPASLPQLALVCAFCRDPQLRESFRLIENLKPGEHLSRETMEAHLETMFPGRYSDAMKKSLAQNVNTSWRDSGHLEGRTKKLRTIPKPTLCGTVYAMLAGYLMGLRGTLLTGSVFGKLVGVDSQQAITMLQAAASRGWCRVRHAGDVLQIDFSPLLIEHEKELINGAA